MEETEIQTNNNFEICFNINVDIKNEISYIESEYLIKPDDKKFMCASLLICTAARIVWLSQTTQNHTALFWYSQFKDIAKTMTFTDEPTSRKYIKIYAIGTSEKYYFNLDYKGFPFWGIFSSEMPNMTSYAFAALYKIFTKDILPRKKNIKFYKNLDKLLLKLQNFQFEDMHPKQIIKLCMLSAIEISFGDEYE